MNDFMHSFFLLHAFHVTSLLAGSAIFFALFIILNETKKNYTNPRSKQIQNIHEKKITRLGGLGIFINLIFLNTAFDSFSFNLSNTIELLVCLLVFVPILITTLFEDFYIQLNPIYRLTAMIVSATIIFLIPGFNLPVIDFPFLDFIFNVPIIKMIIFSLLLIALMNGFNFIDGANGLMTITFLVAMGSIFTISYVVGDDLTMHLILILIGPFIIFFAFNYPLGRIFIGDIGAYLCGWLTGLICFSFFAKHEELTAWSIALISFYPLMEVSFSVIRKVYQGKSPFIPDSNHLHLKLFFFLKLTLNNRLNKSNNLIMPLMTFFWLAPPVTAVLTINNMLLTILALIFFMGMYCIAYRFIPERL